MEERRGAQSAPTATEADLVFTVIILCFFVLGIWGLVKFIAGCQLLHRKGSKN